MSVMQAKQMSDFCTDFCRSFPDAKARIRIDEPMSGHSTFKVGGKADYLLSVASGEELAAAIKIASEAGIPITVLGNGSNILVSDKGIRGLVLVIGKDMASVSVEDDNILKAEAGALLSVVSKYAASYDLAGMEFASGIPGTVGGAVYMNAGAYGGCMEDIVIGSVGLDADKLEVFELKDTGSHKFGYRKSFFAGENAFVLSVKMRLEIGDPDEIKAKMDEFTARRRSSQPLELPSAGSTFKRPEGFYAGRLIEDSGLKGYRVGGACVSQKHAGFIVNDKGATATDILALIDHVKDTVYGRTGVMLEPEVRILGEW